MHSRWIRVVMSLFLIVGAAALAGTAKPVPLLKSTVHSGKSVGEKRDVITGTDWGARVTVYGGKVNPSRLKFDIGLSNRIVRREHFLINRKVVRMRESEFFYTWDPVKEEFDRETLRPGYRTEYFFERGQLARVKDRAGSRKPDQHDRELCKASLKDADYFLAHFWEKKDLAWEWR